MINALQQFLGRQVTIIGLFTVAAVFASSSRAEEIRKASVSIDVERELGKISPYIYGQFIEHLGRSIYGGVWAEMLEDRKFFELVGSSTSPWKRTGGEIGWSLTQDVDRPYTGAASMKIAVAERGAKAAAKELHGLQQGGLGLVAGKRYIGSIVLAGQGAVEVVLRWGPETNQQQSRKIDALTPEFRSYPIEFTAGAATDEGEILVGLRDAGTVWIGTASLMPADHVQGMRADTLAALGELDAPIYRWPGGNFVSGYDWRDGVGVRDRRPPRKNPAWKGIEQNDFGIDEFIQFCRKLKTEPLVVVNTGLGSPELAASLVEYCNGDLQTAGGKRRAGNGHSEPYEVRWWGIGNEMYGAWQLGNMPVERYVVRHNEFVRAMREVDPEIKPIAVGALGPWTEHMLRQMGPETTVLSEHFYIQQENPDPAQHIAAIPTAIRKIVDSHRSLRKTDPDIARRATGIAIDEWNYWYGKHLYGDIGCRYHWKDALGIALGVHEMARNCDMVVMANYAQTVNVLGCVKTTKTAAALESTGVALALYRRQFGSIALTVEGTPAPLDVCAALSTDRHSLTLAIVNPTPTATALRVEVRGAKPGQEALQFSLAAPALDSYNEPGQPPAIAPSERQVPWSPEVKVDPWSITLYRIPLGMK